jgi:hypothetical protein
MCGDYQTVSGLSRRKMMQFGPARQVGKVIGHQYNMGRHGRQRTIKTPSLFILNRL